MIKKFKRYVNNLSFKQTEHLIFCICFALAFFAILFLIINWNNYSGREPGEQILMVFLVIFSIPICAGLSLFILFDVDTKRINEEFEKEKKELQNVFTLSDNTVELAVSDSTKYFPKDIVLFYLEQKGVQVWFESEKCEEIDEIKGKIYITDKDNPDKKIEYPYKITNPLYLKSNFELKN